MFDFKNKVVIVSGSSSGIGAGSAELFAKYGAKVVITGRNEKKLKNVVEVIKKASPTRQKPLSIVADITKESEMETIINLTLKEFGQIDILVNNAGAVFPYKGIADSSALKSYQTTIDTNLKSAFYLSHLAIPHLEKTKGNIINISSIAALSPTPTYGPYCISKAAMDMFTKCLALEVGPKGIRVNSVNPGIIRTDIVANMGVPSEEVNKFYDAGKERSPLGLIGESNDIARAIAYLASEKFISGTIFVVDGGALNYGPIRGLEN